MNKEKKIEFLYDHLHDCRPEINCDVNYLEHDKANNVAMELAEESLKLDEIKAVMDLPETSIGETFTKLRKVKEIVEGME